MEEGYCIYVSDLIPLELRSIMPIIMRAEDALMREYGKFATKITFNGAIGQAILKLIDERRINLGAEYVRGRDTEESIELEYPAKTKVATTDVIRDFAFEYTIEREVKPKLTINIKRYNQ